MSHHLTWVLSGLLCPCTSTSARQVISLPVLSALCACCAPVRSATCKKYQSGKSTAQRISYFASGSCTVLYGTMLYCSVLCCSVLCFRTNLANGRLSRMALHDSIHHMPTRLQATLPPSFSYSTSSRLATTAYSASNCQHFRGHER